MASWYRLELLAIVAIIAFCIIFFYTNSTMNGADFVGTDTIVAEKISESAGLSERNISPLIPQWVPPSGEIESTLFALQAAAGGFLIGIVFGYWIGQKKQNS